MTGWNWQGIDEVFIHAPAQYGAIHFHEDDLEDCRWETDIAWTVPDDLRSGRLRAAARPGRGRGLGPVLRAAAARHGDGEGLVPRPDRELSRLRERAHRPRRPRRAGDPRAHVGDRRAGLLALRPPRVRALDLRLRTSDGSGVHYSSALRPIMNMRPKFRMATGGPLAVPGRPPSRRLARRDGRSSTTSRPTASSTTRARRCSSATTSSSPARTPSTTRREMLDAWEEYLARRRPGHVPGLERLLLDRSRGTPRSRG